MDLITPESLLRGMLLDAADAQRALSFSGPEHTTTDYLNGLGEGRRIGLATGMAIALSCVTGESPTALLGEAYDHAAMQEAFPFETHFVAVGDDYPEEA